MKNKYTKPFLSFEMFMPGDTVLMSSGNQFFDGEEVIWDDDFLD